MNAILNILIAGSVTICIFLVAYRYVFTSFRTKYIKDKPTGSVPDKPFNTLSEAIDEAEDREGAMIFVAPGHNEQPLYQGSQYVQYPFIRTQTQLYNSTSFRINTDDHIYHADDIMRISPDFQFMPTPVPEQKPPESSLKERKTERPTRKIDHG